MDKKGCDLKMYDDVYISKDKHLKRLIESRKILFPFERDKTINLKSRIEHEYAMQNYRGSFNKIFKDIWLNGKILIEAMKTCKKSLIEVVVETITHESMHVCLCIEISAETSRKYDNIHKKLRKEGYNA